MAKEICISSTPHETRLAILEDDQLAEIYYERENEYTLAGSIYNGRVTRVLPGMQSAFVDVGLERDAFLYVTDFLELEDQEETDEVEKAAATGSNTPPREVRHTGGPERGQDRVQDRKDTRGQKPEQKQEQRPERPSPERPSLDKQVSDRPAQDRPARERRFTVEAVPETGEVSPAAPAPTYASEQAAIDEQESGEPGAKRWRGRRRRRGGRGASDSQESQGETRVSGEVYAEAAPEPEVAEGIQAEAGVPASHTWSAPAPTHHFDAAPVPFVLPGESLSKYGGTPAEGAPTTESETAAPARPSSSFKPATLIETPIVWDGSGLLPGESLSRHRGSSHEPSEEAARGPQESSTAADEFEEEAFVEEMTDHESASEYLPDPEDKAVPELLALDEEEDDLTEETTEAPAEEKAPVNADDYTVETEIPQPAADEPLASPVTRQDEVVPEPETDASAFHNVDPAAPTGFRLFGFGKKKEEEAEKARKAAPVSTYSPGSGLIEEEIGRAHV